MDNETTRIYPNTPQGQRDKKREISEREAGGWSVLSEKLLTHADAGTKLCCCGPSLTPSNNGRIVVTFRPDEAIYKQSLFAKKLIQEFKATLRTKRLQLETADEYGVVDRTGWEEHKKYFAFHLIERRLGLTLHTYVREAVPDWIDDALDADAPQVEPAEPNRNDGRAYESQCADLLRQLGWTVTETGKSGDQGADIIAQKFAVRVAVQCKHYEGSVGNAAIQEALSARHFYEATHAAVVSRSSFTASAKALAARTGVFLLHEGALEDLNDITQH
ncbi:MAG: restriction endonuclease [Gemmatimonadaceae bacterium]|nr:restriction endonuclease [Gemmatimonadaceae bacterium]